MNKYTCVILCLGHQFTFVLLGTYLKKTKEQKKKTIRITYTRMYT